jgi:hypothetical protein
VHEHDAELVDDVLLGLERRFEHGGDARVPSCGRQRLVRYQLRLQHDAQRLADGFDLVVDGGNRPLGQRDQSLAADADARTGRRSPQHVAREATDPEIEHALVLLEQPVAHIERLIVDEEADDLAVGDIDHRLAGLGIAEAGLGVGKGPQLEQRVEIHPGEAVRIAFVEVAPHPDVTVRQREHRLGVREHVDVEMRFADAPRFDIECFVVHGTLSSRSARSVTTMSAPCARSPSASE